MTMPTAYHVAALGFSEPQVRNLRDLAAAEGTVVHLPWDTRTAGSPEQACAAAQLVLIGPRIEQPVALAQRLIAREPRPALALVCREAETAAVTEAVERHPMLGRRIPVLSEDGLDTLPETIAQLRGRSQNRHRHAALVQAINRDLSIAAMPATNRARYLDQLLDHAPIGVMTVAPDGRILAVNRLAEQQFAPASRPMDGSASVFDLFPASQTERLRAIIADVGDGAESARGEMRGLGGDSDRHFSIVAAPADANGGGDIMLIFQDLTDLIRSQQDQELARIQAEAANQSKSRLLAGVSHELRTPMNAISGFSEVMTRELFGSIDNARYREYAQLIFDSARHLTTLIDDLLDLSKIEAGVLEPSEEPVNLCATAQECIRLVGREAENRGQTLSLDCRDDSLWLLADRRMIRQLLINLLSNAIKFTPNEGTIVTTIAHHDNGVRICVEDNGVGISEEDVDKVLRPFERGMNTASGFVEGSGIGLFLVQRIVTLHDGSLQIESATGAGTRIHVLLPQCRVIAAPADVTASEPSLT